MPLDFARLERKPKVGDKMIFASTQCDSLIPDGHYIGTVTYASYVLGRNTMGTEWVAVQVNGNESIKGTVNVRYKIGMENVEHATEKEGCVSVIE